MSDEIVIKPNKFRIFAIAIVAACVGGAAGAAGTFLWTKLNNSDQRNVDLTPIEIDAGRAALYVPSRDGKADLHPYSFASTVTVAGGRSDITVARARDAVTESLFFAADAQIVPHAQDDDLSLESAVRIILKDRNTWVEDIEIVRLVPGSPGPSDQETAPSPKNNSPH